MKVLVVTPTYCERESLAGTLTRLRAAVPHADVLVVDDDSPDGTGRLADALAAADPQVHVLHRTGPRGLGRAYVAGFGWGLERGYDVLVEMDADGSHQPEDLPRLLAALSDAALSDAALSDAALGAHGADAVIGSRWVPGGSVRNWPRRREALSRGANLYTRIVLGLPLRDATAGYRAYTRRVLERVHLEDVASQGYCFQVDLTLRAVQEGFTVVEVPITFVERELGSSKMSRQIVVEALTRVTVWGVTRRVGSARRRLGASAQRRGTARWRS